MLALALLIFVLLAALTMARTGFLRAALYTSLILLAAACASKHETHYAVRAMSTLGPSPSPTVASPITHVVIVIQENRSLDNLFNGFPNANTVTSGQGVTLVPLTLVTTWDIKHRHIDWMNAWDHGAMDGWPNEKCTGTGCPTNAAYAYVPESNVPQYWAIAAAFTLADNMFATQEGPSFPGHQYLTRGTSTASGLESRKWSENPTGSAGGCNAPTGTTVVTIDVSGNEDHEVYPCNKNASTPTMFGLLDTAGLSWRYYQASCQAGLWTAPYAVQSIYQNDDANIICPNPSQFLTDVAGGSLSAVTWVTPTPECSDHAQLNTGCGPSWVASIVNAIGSAGSGDCPDHSFWCDTAIFVTWDDWGGWYDHVAPHIYNSFELGFRVPLLVVSPYALVGNVDHTPHEFGSILKYVEQNFNLPSLGTTDVRADNLSVDFNYLQTPTPFTPFSLKYSKQWLLGHFSHAPVDY